MRPGLGKCDFNLPAPNVAGDDFHRIEIRICTHEGLRFAAIGWVANDEEPRHRPQYCIYLLWSFNSSNPIGRMTQGHKLRRIDSPKTLIPTHLVNANFVQSRAQLSGRNSNYARQVINAFLQCLDSLDGREGVVVVTATNNVNAIDPAIIRSGRIERHVYIPLPEAIGREKILKYHLRDALPGEDISEIAVSCLVARPHWRNITRHQLSS